MTANIQRPRTAWLHIGLPKTGSSSIQRFLKANKVALMQRRIQTFVRADELLAASHGAPLHIPLAPGVETLIISDENMGDYLPDQLPPLIEAIGDYADEIWVIVYIRRADETRLSGYVTHLLSSGSLDRLEETLCDPLIYPFDRLRHWEPLVGRQRIVMRRFGRDYLPDGGVIADFCHVVGIDPADLRLPDRFNVTPGMDVLELIRLLNALDPPLVERRRRLKLLTRIRGEGRRPGMARAQREALIELTAADTRKVSKHYLRREEVFTHAIADDATPHPELGAEDVVRLMRELGEALNVCFLERDPADRDEALRWAADCLEQIRTDQWLPGAV